MELGNKADEIRVVQTLTDAERLSIQAWDEEQGAFGLVWRPVQMHVLRYVAGVLVAKAGIVEHRLASDVDGELRIGGVGGVITKPSVRGHGHATAVMNYVGGYLCEQLKVNFGMLFCRDKLIPFYEALGWEVLEGPLTFQQPSGSVSSPFPAMILSCVSAPWPKRAVNLNSEPW